MKSEPLMICENCGHKVSDHDESSCHKWCGISIAVVIAATIIAFAFAIITSSFGHALLVSAFVVVIVGTFFGAFVICDCEETYRPKHKHRYICECGDEK